MSMAADLRQKASRHRKLASIPTNGGHCTNRLLLQLADHLDRQAVELETQSAEPEAD